MDSVSNLPMSTSPSGYSPSPSSQSSQRDDVFRSSSLAYEPSSRFQPSWPQGQQSAFEAFDASHAATYRQDIFSTPVQQTIPFEGLSGQTPWAQSPAPDAASATHIYPPLDTLFSPHTGIAPSFDMESGLTPMFGTFNTAVPTNESFGSTSSLPVASRPHGPVRGYSASSLPTMSTRRRASTITSPSTASPVTPVHSYYPYSSPHIYTYPSPHQQLPHTQMQVQQGLGQSENARTGRLFRQPSAPAFGETKRIFHPSPSLAQGEEGVHYHAGAGAAGMGMGMGMEFGMGGAISMGVRMEQKPPRFKPTKEQLVILIKSYEENKNPDGPTREALAKQLGPDIRPKTLQIWFQNRRSKSRAKERDAATVPKLATSIPNVRQLSADERLSLFLSSPLFAGPGEGTRSKQMQAERDAVKRLTRDSSTSLVVLPVTVLSIAKWTRFLTPGTGQTHPDLGAALYFSLPYPTLHLYILHNTLFRIDIVLSPATVQGLQATSNPRVNPESAAVKFQVAEGGVEFSGWEDTTGWGRIGDFTAGQAGRGGQVELTGSEEVLLPEFIKVQQLLSSTAHPMPIPSAHRPTLNHIQTEHSPSPWRFLNSSLPSSTPASELLGPPSADFQPRPSLGVFNGMTHQRQRSFSQPQFRSTTFLAEPAASPLPSPPQDSQSAGLQMVLGTHLRMESISSAKTENEMGAAQLENGISGLEWLTMGGESSRNSWDGEEVEDKASVKQDDRA
ncbi:hypothetical protein IAR50_005338 [Cryptococcus sp. DSM 104548]